MWITGDKLSPRTRKQVLASYGYRWTHENHHVYRNMRHLAPRIPLVSDSEWLAEHAFKIKKDGTLDNRNRHCMPAYFADIKE